MVGVAGMAVTQEALLAIPNLEEKISHLDPCFPYLVITRSKFCVLRLWLDKKLKCVYPSPQDLKGRILIKGKRLNKLDAFFTAENTVDDDSVSEDDEAAEGEDDEEKEPKVQAELNPGHSPN